MKKLSREIKRNPWLLNMNKQSKY